jgi:hypothetical protein
MRRGLLIGVVLALRLAPQARAAEARCWFENGEVVTAAQVGGITGDFILDLNAPHTLLHDTQAQTAGVAAREAKLSVVLAGLRRDLDVSIVDLDARALGFPTPIAGVLGQDVLGGRAMRVSLVPCRLWLLERHQAQK